MRRICVFITARPSYARVRSTLLALAARGDVELDIVLAASALVTRYGNIENVLVEDGLTVNARIHSMFDGSGDLIAAKTTAIGLMEAAAHIDATRPDIVVTIADRYETIATAIAASYQNVCLAHIQGGEITGNIDEKVRHSITKLADIHLPSTAQAAEFIARMGEAPDRIFVTGCPSIDIAAEVAAEDTPLFDPYARYHGVGGEPALDGGYLVALQHPVTTEREAAAEQTRITLAATRQLGMPVLWFWPNVDSGSDAVSRTIRIARENDALPDFHFFINFAPDDFLRLLKHSSGIVGNSSVGVRETSYLGVPSVNIGGRQAHRERGPNVIDVGHDEGEILAALRTQLAHGPYERSTLYGDGRAGPRIAEILATCPTPTEKYLRYVA